MDHPTATDCYGNAWQQVWRQFPILLLVLLATLGIKGFGEGLAGSDDGGLASLVGAAFWVFLSGPIGVGMAWASLRAARGDRVKFGDLFAGFENYWASVSGMLVTTLAIVVGCLFLIIPGIFIACRLAFVPYLIVDRRMGGLDAMQESWDMTGGHGWTVFVIGLLAVPICFGGLLAFIVGILPAMLLIDVAFASLYGWVSDGYAPLPSAADPLTA